MIHAKGAEATFDFEEGGGLVEYFGWEVSFCHNLFAGTEAFGQGGEDESFGIGVADEVLFLEFFAGL